MLLRVVLLAAAGCGGRRGGEAAEVPVEIDVQAPILDLAPCFPLVADQERDQVIAVRLFVGPGVDGSALARELRAADLLLGRYGVRVVPMAASATVVPMDSAIAGDAGKIDRVLASLEPDEVNDRVTAMLVSRLSLAPLRQLLREHSGTSSGEVNVVVLPHIVAPGSPFAPHLPHMAGLTVSARMSEPFAPAGPLAAEMDSMLQLARTPTVILSAAELERMRPGSRQTTLAHELGHAAGLAHRTDASNLMAAVSKSGCVPGLDATQLAELRAGLTQLDAAGRTR